MPRATKAKTFRITEPGRPRHDPYDEHDQPDDNDSLPPDIRVWVEGETFIPGWNDEDLERVQRLKPELAILKLTLCTQNTTEGSTEPRRRKWTARRIGIDEVQLVLLEYPTGICYQDLIERLFKEDPWTPAMQQASKVKTGVLVHRMLKGGLIEKRRTRDGGLYIHARDLSNDPVTPVRLARAMDYIKHLELDMDEIMVASFLRYTLKT